MIWALTGVAGLLCLWAAAAGYLSVTRNIAFRQGLLYAPLKAVFFIRGDRLPAPSKGRGTIYVVSHRSRLDPALMLSLLPAQTLHILDHDTSTAWWMEPFRELARTIPFNATHVFVSRRLVRLLRGNGSIAVYLPDDAEPDTRAFRLFRAVARIALKADAAVVPIRVGAPGAAVSDRSVRGRITGWPRPNLTLSVVAPVTIAELRQRPGESMITASNALFDRVAQTRICDMERLGSTFHAVAQAASRFSDTHAIQLAQPGKPRNYGDLLLDARLIADRLARKTQEGDMVGLYLPGSPHLLPAFLATQSAGVGAVMLDAAHDAGRIARATRQSAVRRVLTSRDLVDHGATEVLAALEEGGARIHYVEDILEGAGGWQQLSARLLRHQAVARPSPEAPAALFLAPDENAEGLEALSHRRLLTSVAQVATRLRLRDASALVSALPPSHPVGLAAGVLLPLMTGLPLHLAASDSPGPSILDSGDSVLLFAAPAQAKSLLAARQNSATHLRVVLCSDGTSEIPGSDLRHYGTEILQAFMPAGATGLVTLSSSSHNRATTLGRFLPSLRVRLTAVEGIERGGHLLVAPPGTRGDGPEANDAERPDPVMRGWFDTGALVSLDREGFVSWLGRAGRFATIGETEVPLSPCEVLAARLWPLAQHRAIGLDDRRKGQRIVLLTTHGNPDKPALKKLARSLGLGDLLLPTDIVQLDTLPVEADGEFDEVRAREMAVEAAGRSRAA